MSKARITEIKYSVDFRTPELDKHPSEVEEGTSIVSTETAWLVAHVIYCSDYNLSQGICVDLGVIATKTTDVKSGLVTEFTDKDLKMTLEEIMTKCQEAVDAKVESDNKSACYDSVVKSACETYKATKTVLGTMRYSDPMNSFRY